MSPQPSRPNIGPRSLPHRAPYVGAILIALVHYLALIATATLAYILFQNHTPNTTMWFLLAVGVVIISWILGLVRRRSIKCPLCKGTPLFDSHAVRHRKAFKLPPLNYGNTALVSLLFTHKFRCMYCGSLFDLLKKPGQRR